MTIFWFLISALFIFLELLNPGLFFFIALSIGALITMFAQLQEITIMQQYIIFFGSSSVMVLFLNIFVKILQNKKRSQMYDSNAYAMIGKFIKITEIISPDTGYGQVNGEIWMVKLHNNNQTLTIGAQALIIGVKGCHLQINFIKETL